MTEPKQRMVQMTEQQVNYMTSLLVDLPYRVAAPIIKILGGAMLEARKHDDDEHDNSRDQPD
jgi:hypothetical protein